MLWLSLLAVSGTRVLMLGNSHTHSHELPGTVRAILNADARMAPVTVQTMSGAFLEDMARDPAIRREVSSGRWDVIVLQAAKVSSSHKYRYSQAGGIELARAAKTAGARTMLFAEWPRRGWPETDFILNVYREISAPTRAEIIPVGRAWDALLAQRPAAPLWEPDGNHASPMGATLAAYTIACYILRSDTGLPILPVTGVPPADVSLLAKVAATTWRRGKGT